METKPAEALRIGMIAPPFLPVPPLRYGGTERIVGVLAEGLKMRGHQVSVFASGDSTVSTMLIPTVPRSLWEDGGPTAEAAVAMARTLELAVQHESEFDIIHSHVEWHGFPFARAASVPVVSTLHGRIDIGPTADALRQYPDVPLVAISEKQRSFWPNQNWAATILHGLPFDDVRLGSGEGEYLLFVGRLTPEKGVDAAIELAQRAGLPLLIAAKAIDDHEVQHYDQVVAPAERAGVVRFLGEVGPPGLDRLFGDALATVMLGEWPEPFGLVAVESLATGTPLIARRAGALPEIVREGIDGFVVDDVDQALAALTQLRALDRGRIRADTLRRFSSDQMVADYEEVFARLVERGTPAAEGDGVTSHQAKTPLGVT